MIDGHIGIRAPRTIAARLDDLRGIENGWLDGCGLAPKTQGLDWLAQCCKSHYPYALPPPYLYPTAEGGVQAEWSFGPYEITLEIDLDRRVGECHLLDTRTQTDESQVLELTESDSWTVIAEHIKGYTVITDQDTQGTYQPLEEMRAARAAREKTR